MKKIFFLSVLLVSLLIIPVSAANVGDKISEAVYTDIVAYVNNYPMPAYVIDGYAVIVAEDLRDYCCDVVYDEITRSLYITKAGEDAKFANNAVYSPIRVCKIIDYYDVVSGITVGSYYTDVLYTDIKTYVNGNEVKSFNVNGKTMIVIDEFGKYMDGYTWDDVNRAALAWIDGKEVAEFRKLSIRNQCLIGPEDFEGLSFAEFDKYDSLYYNYTGKYDMDFDGVKENISIKIGRQESGRLENNEIWNDTRYMEIAVGNRKKVINDLYLTSLHYISICDLDVTDGVKDLLIVTCEQEQGGYTYYFYKYDESLNLRLAVNTSGNLTFNSDGSIGINTGGSNGRWSINRTYRQGYGLEYVEDKPAYYEINYNNGYWPTYYGKATDKEKAMWRNNYIKAYCDWNGENGFKIKKGEYFIFLYDNGEGYAFVEKTNGESGWIYVWSGTSNLNPHFFASAG